MTLRQIKDTPNLQTASGAQWGTTSTVFKSNFRFYLQSNSNWEILNNEYWFVDLDNLLDKFYYILYAKTMDSYWIWTDDEMPDLRFRIYGNFFPILIEKLFNLFIRQLPLVNKDIHELSDWKNRGELLLSEAGQSANSQPSENGYKWDFVLDAPSFKSASDRVMVNRIISINQMLSNNLTLNFYNIFNDFQWMFINKNWVDKYIERINS